MTRAQLILLASLVVATFAPPTWAQTPKDSAAKDSTAPKKTGRFGGLMNKAKQVAGSKAAQGVAKVAGNKAVQGVAMGVACTVVPGAAAVSAATGAGPCANGLMNGLMSGNAAANIAARAAGAASGAASTAAQAATMKAMMGGKGGASGAAAAAAMGAMGGMGGTSVMSADAIAAAKKMMSGLGGSASAGGTPSGKPGNSKASSTSATNAPAAPAANLWVNYDFVPGDRVIFYTDYADDQVGNFPQRLQFVEGNMEVAELGGQRLMRATSPSAFIIPLPETLPERFTIEIDVINRPSLDGTDFHLRGKAARMDDPATSLISWGSDGASLTGGSGGEVKLSNHEANRLRYRGKATHVRVLGDGKYIKVYLDEKRMANVPNANFERSKVLHLIIDARSEDNAAYIGRIRVAESRRSIYDDLVAAGHVATQGLLFDTGSDQLRPESTPTLKQIAAMLEQHPELRLRIEGHTDNVGAKDANRTLSDKRAAAVKAVLVGAYYHVNAGRLESKGFGDTKPAGTNATPEGRSNNRRVELVKL
jgi:outer membrane protein OmpA-like peptidoglycan-associated protein